MYRLCAWCFGVPIEGRAYDHLRCTFYRGHRSIGEQQLMKCDVLRGYRTHAHSAARKRWRRTPRRFHLRCGAFLLGCPLCALWVAGRCVAGGCMRRVRLRTGAHQRLSLPHAVATPGGIAGAPPVALPLQMRRSGRTRRSGWDALGTAATLVARARRNAIGSHHAQQRWPLCYCERRVGGCNPSYCATVTTPVFMVALVVTCGGFGPRRCFWAQADSHMFVRNSLLGKVFHASRTYVRRR